jgi:Zn-dependent protease with chaperone function
VRPMVRSQDLKLKRRMRNAEIEADTLAVKTLQDKTVTEGATYFFQSWDSFEKMAKQDQSYNKLLLKEVSPEFDTHPPFSERIENVLKMKVDLSDPISSTESQ